MTMSLLEKCVKEVRPDIHKFAFEAKKDKRHTYEKMI